VPAVEPLTLPEVKHYLRVTASDTEEDGLLKNLITSARMTAERYLRSALITQSWKVAFDGYAPASVCLQMGPIQSITHVKSFSKSEEEALISSALYRLNAGRDRVWFDASPIGHRIEITYVNGYGDGPDAVPAPIRQGLLQHVSDIYNGRAGIVQLSESIEVLYGAFRTVRI
jgi:uncharacterized phiE125 gp8 family phage protein